MTASLYQRLGGAAGIAAIVDEAVDRHAANPLLAARLRGKDLPQLKSLGVAFLVAGSGGPPPNQTCAAPTAQAGMPFSEDEADAVVADVAAAMVEQGAAAAEVGEVVRLVRAPEVEALRRRFGSPMRCASGAAIGNDSGTGPA